MIRSLSLNLDLIFIALSPIFKRKNSCYIETEQRWRFFIVFYMGELN